MLLKVWVCQLCYKQCRQQRALLSKLVCEKQGIK